MTDSLPDSDWDIVQSLLPADWRESARQCGALRRCRKIPDADTLLRLILLHVAGGLSLRQTVARAAVLGWAELSDVALLKRLRASANWLEYLCSELWQAPSLPWPAEGWIAQRTWRVIDASGVQRPGCAGTDWRVHYSIRLPSLACDFVAVTDRRGGESLQRLPVHPSDVVLADRGYSHRAGVAWVLAHQADLIVRHQPNNFPVLDQHGEPWEVLPAARRLSGHRPGRWAVQFESEGRRWPMWLCAVRKSRAAIERAHARLRQEHGAKVRSQTLEWAEYVLVLTSLPAEKMTTSRVLECYRGRWQIELVFKRLKSLLGLGDLAKYDPASTQAWLQAKLLTALLMSRLEHLAGFFSPWGFVLDPEVAVAGIPGSTRQSAALGGSRLAANDPD
jgi:hypothetical protein